MKQVETFQDGTIRQLDSSFMIKVFYCFVALAGLSVTINFAGKQLGRTIVMAGHTDNTAVYEIVIGNNVIALPANEIRFERQRRSGATTQVDTYLRWPTMTGYSVDQHDTFNHADGNQDIVFVSIRERAMSRDMSGRMKPIYSALIEQPGTPGPAGIVYYEFRKKSGYVNEILAVAEKSGKKPFVARCLKGEAAITSLAACERDVHVGDDLSITYRFSDTHLKDWRSLDAQMMAYAAKRIDTGR